MKKDVGFVLLGIFSGASVWMADAVIDYYFFLEEGTASFAIFDVSSHEFFMRSVISLSFIAIGVVGAKLVHRGRQGKEALGAALIFQQNLLNAIPIPVFYKDADRIYMGCNKSFAEFLGIEQEKIIGKSVYDLAPRSLAETYEDKDMALMNRPGVQIYDFEVEKQSGEKRKVVFHKATFRESDGRVGGLIGAILDITDREKTEREKDLLIRDLKEALEKVKLLSGMLPICSSCKKIRDDRGYWRQIEEYIARHSEAAFSHGICPACAKRMYPNISLDDEDNFNS